MAVREAADLAAHLVLVELRPLRLPQQRFIICLLEAERMPRRSEDRHAASLVAGCIPLLPFPVSRLRLRCALWRRAARAMRTPAACSRIANERIATGRHEPVPRSWRRGESPANRQLPGTRRNPPSY